MFFHNLETEKSVAMVTVARYWQKIFNMQGFATQGHTRDSKVPESVAMPDIAEKLISFDLCRSMKCKEPITLFISQRNRKCVTMATLASSYCGNTCSGADFTNGLKPVFGLKFKTLVLNSVKNVLSQRA